jgi:hypothetical protein
MGDEELKPAQGVGRSAESGGQESRSDGAGAAEIEIERKLAEIFPGAGKVKILPLDGGKKKFLALIRHAPASRTDIARKRGEIIRHFAGGGLSVLTIFYSDRQWDDLGRQSEEPKWLSCFDPAGGDVSLAGIYRERKDYPASWRRMLVKTIGSYCEILGSMLSTDRLPAGFALSASLGILEDVLRLLYSAKGLAFSADARALDLFETHFAKNPRFKPEDPLLFFELSAMVIKHRHFTLLSGTEEYEPEQGDLIERVLKFLMRSRKYVIDEFTSENERMRRNKIFKASLAALLALVLAGAVWGGVETTRRMSPISPVRDASVIRSPGGIAGTYYSGTGFNHKLSSRVDSRIFFSSAGTVAPGVPPDNFSARWTGYIHFPQPGDWKVKPVTETCGKVKVKSGWIPLKMEYFEAVGEAVLNLIWGTDKKNLRTVPAANLCCTK